MAKSVHNNWYQSGTDPGGCDGAGKCRLADEVQEIDPLDAFLKEVDGRFPPLMRLKMAVQCNLIHSFKAYSVDELYEKWRTGTCEFCDEKIGEEGLSGHNCKENGYSIIFFNEGSADELVGLVKQKISENEEENKLDKEKEERTNSDEAKVGEMEKVKAEEGLTKQNDEIRKSVANEELGFSKQRNKKEEKQKSEKILSADGGDVRTSGVSGGGDGVVEEGSGGRNNSKIVREIEISIVRAKEKGEFPQSVVGVDGGGEVIDIGSGVDGGEPGGGVRKKREEDKGGGSGVVGSLGADGKKVVLVGVVAGSETAGAWGVGVGVGNGGGGAAAGGGERSRMNFVREVRVNDIRASTIVVSQVEEKGKSTPKSCWKTLGIRVGGSKVIGPIYDITADVIHSIRVEGCEQLKANKWCGVHVKKRKPIVFEDIWKILESRSRGSIVITSSHDNSADVINPIFCPIFLLGPMLHYDLFQSWPTYTLPSTISQDIFIFYSSILFGTDFTTDLARLTFFPP